MSDIEIVKLSEISLQREMAQARVNFVSTLIESFHFNQPLAIFHYIRTLTNQNVIPSFVKLDKTCSFSDYDKACLFNHSVFTKSSFHLPPISELAKPQTFISFSELDVYYALLSLDVSKAVGCDGISPGVHI